VNGLQAIAVTFNGLARGSGNEHDIARLERWSSQIEGRGACRFPDGAIRFLRSALDVFGADLRRHALGSMCDGARLPPLLPLSRASGGWR
jgi:NADH:ubiquinone oxidoreductase subunit F (NADH-binding)